MTRQFPTLSRAPIREAVIDFRANTGIQASQESYDQFASLLGTEFVERKQIFTSVVTLEISEQGKGAQHVSTEQQGERMATATGNIVVQVQPAGVSTSVLRPYENWQHLLNRFQAAWRAYTEVFKPVSVSRVAARYINEFLIPRQDPISDWLKLPHKFPAGLGFEVQSELTRYELFNPHKESMILLTQAVSSQGDSSAVTLDIDAIFQREFSPRDDEIWQSLENLRVSKNRVFFGLLKKQALERFR